MSLSDVPLSTVPDPLRVSENCCLPTAMGTWNVEAPAGAWNDCALFPPEVMVTVPGAVSRATTNTESDMVCQPSGRPSLSVESQLSDPSVGRYQ